jgi:hypothetical protein
MNFFCNIKQRINRVQKIFAQNISQGFDNTTPNHPLRTNLQQENKFLNSIVIRQRIWPPGNIDSSPRHPPYLNTQPTGIITAMPFLAASLPLLFFVI